MQSASRFFREQIINNGAYAICFSIYNLIELKGQGEKILSFSDFFDNWPVLLFHDISEFYKQEHAAAKTGETFKLEQRFIADFYGASATGKIDINSYPSQRVGLYSQFCRVHKMRRSLEVNDVIDVILSGYSAFVDVIITEAFQANVLRVLQGRIPSLRSLEVLRLSDIR